MRTILAVGHDEHLLSSRSAILRRLQADVVVANKKEAVRVLAARRVDLVILCHTLAVPEVTEIASLARQRNAATRILQVLSTELEFSLPHIVDEAITAKPDMLVSKVSQMLVN